MLIETPTGPPFAVDRTNSGRIRLSRTFSSGAHEFFMFTRDDARATAAAIVRVLESQDHAATSMRMEVGPPMVVRRQTSGLRLSRTFKDSESWLSASESAAADIAAALLEMA